MHRWRGVLLANPLVDDDRIFGANVDVPAAMGRPVGSPHQSLCKVTSLSTVTSTRPEIVPPPG